MKEKIFRNYLEIKSLKIITRLLDNKDIKERKLTLPLIHVLQKVDKKSKRMIINTIKKHNQDPIKINKIISIVIENGGNLSGHMHKEGWLSGSFYLERPEKKEEHDGDIIFSLHGSNYPLNKKIFPEEGFSAPAIILKVVVFPAPFGPIKPTISPSGTSKLTPRTAFKPP